MEPMCEREEINTSLSILLRFLTFLSFGGDAFGSRNGLFRGFADAEGFGTLFAAIPFRAVVESHEGRPVESCVAVRRCRRGCRRIRCGGSEDGFLLPFGAGLSVRRKGPTARFSRRPHRRRRRPGRFGFGDLGDGAFAPRIEAADDLLGFAEGHGNERIIVEEFHVVDVFVAQSASEFEHVDDLTGRVAVAPSQPEQEARRTLAVDRERADFGIAALIQFAAERQTQQGAERYVGFVAGQQFAGHVGVVGIGPVFDDLAQFVADACTLHRHDVLPRGKGLLAHVGLDVVHHVSESPEFRRRDEGDGRPLIAGAARASDAVHVTLRILRQRVVDYVGEVADVDAAGGYVGGHENVGCLGFEFAEDLFALGLRHVAVKRFGRIASFGELLHDLVCGYLRAHEYDAVELRFDVDDAREGVEFVGLAYFETDLVGEVGRELLVLDAHDLRVVHVAFRQLHDPLGHRGREEQHAPLAGRVAHDLLDVLDETHVEHLVGLVQYEVAHPIQSERTAPDVVEHTARGADDDVRAARQAAELLAHGGPAVDGRDRETAFAVVGEELLGRLQGQFARRHEDDGLHALLRGAERLEDREPVGGGFSGSGLRLGDDIVALSEKSGNGECLNGGRGFEPFGTYGFEHFVRKTQRAEILCFGHKSMFTDQRYDK